MKKVPNEEDPRPLHRFPVAITGEGNEGEEEEEGDVAEVETEENDEEVNEATIRLTRAKSSYH